MESQYITLSKTDWLVFLTNIFVFLNQYLTQYHKSMNKRSQHHDYINCDLVKTGE